MLQEAIQLQQAPAGRTHRQATALGQKRSLSTRFGPQPGSVAQQGSWTSTIRWNDYDAWAPWDRSRNRGSIISNSRAMATGSSQDRQRRGKDVCQVSEMIYSDQLCS